MRDRRKVKVKKMESSKTKDETQKEVGDDWGNFDEKK